MRAIERMESLLAAQQVGLSRLLALCEQERTCLLNGNIQQLDTVTREQAELLARHAILCTQTFSALEAAASQLHLPAQTAMSALLAHLDLPTGQRLQSSARILTEMADTLQREGRINWHLAQQALRYVDFTLKVISQAKDGPRPYAPSTQPPPAMSAQLLVDSCA
jgi:hypothetical protein